MLGPVRFTHIEDCAKEAIQKWKTGNTAATTKKRKVGEEHDLNITTAGTAAVEVPFSQPGPQTPMRPEEVQRQRHLLIKELQERDANIAILRKLLDDKKAKVDPLQSPSSSAPSKSMSPSKLPDYSSMTLVRLQAMDKARDASISYLLKELDKVDKEQEAEDELDAAFAEANKQKQLEDDWNTMEMELAKEKAAASTGVKSKQPIKSPPPKKAQTPDAFDDGDDEDVFDEAWKANEQLLTPKKSQGVQVNDEDLPDSPARRAPKKRADAAG